MTWVLAEFTDMLDQRHHRVNRSFNSTTKQSAQRSAKYLPLRLSGNHIGKVLPVPIPNTAVKLFEPMIVHTSVKVGIAGFLKSLLVACDKKAFFMRPAIILCPT